MTTSVMLIGLAAVLGLIVGVSVLFRQPLIEDEDDPFYNAEDEWMAGQRQKDVSRWR